MTYPVIFRLGPFVLPAYTACMLLAVLVGVRIVVHEARRRGRLTEPILRVAFAGLLGGVLGAKLSMLVFLGPATFWRLLPTIPFHGAAYSGALFGGYVAVVLMERRLHIAGCTGDLIAPALPLGQAIGRLGNFLAGDAYGLPTSLPWGLTMAGARRQPVQFYEAALDLVLFAVLWRWRCRLRRDGDIFRLYVVGYALIRFPLEFLRYQPTPLALLGLTLVQWLCLASLLGFGHQLFLSSRGAACVCDLLPRGQRRRVVA
ncbi:MAG TPA: prolipoprotein diacylglyceryl transferase [Thermomicrobiales bacterium]|nr:prolipoprotein diacylglyceryl transferase [Thermomicrobiales bacterium]